MNALWDWLNQPIAVRIGWALLHSLWEGALAAALFAFLRVALRRRSPNARYLAGCVVLFSLALAPLLTVLYLPASLAHATGTYTTQLQNPNVGMLFTSATLGSSPFNGALSGMISNTSESIEKLLPWIVAAWCFGALFSLSRLLRGCWSLHVLRSKETEPLDLAWLETLNDLRCRLNISRQVRLLKSGLVEVPSVIGWIAPVILLPASSLLGLNPAQLEAVLAHELAHVSRHDYLINLFQLAIETVMFYHPAVWWISSCIREERENCCDDLVTRVCEDRVVYASALATLEELRAASPQFALAAGGGPLLRRIRRLVGTAGVERPASVREIGGLGLLAVGLTLMVAGVCLALGQPLYRAVARIKVEPDTAAQITSNDGKVLLNLGPSYDPYFIQTQFEVIQSDFILSKVIQDLDLSKSWSKRLGEGENFKNEDIITQLRAHIELRPVRNTSLIEIRVYSDSPDEAAKLANAIATAYREHLREQHIQRSRRGIEALDEHLKKQEKEIEEAQANVSNLREKLQIPGVVANADTPTTLLSAESLRKVEAQRMETKTDLVKQKTMLTKLKELSHAVLVQTLPTAVQDQLLTTLLEQQNVTEQSLVIKKKNFGPGHVEIIQLESQLEDLRDKIKKRVDGILGALDARVTALQASLDALESEVKAATINDIETAHKSQPYFEAKRRLEQLQRFAQMLALKIASEKIDVELPISTSAEIIDAAQPPLRPISPNRYRGAACSGIGLLLALVGLFMVRTSSGRTPAPA